MFSTSTITGVLFLLTAVDGVLTLWIGLLPNHFLRTLHGSTDPNSRILARRTAGFWGAFTLIQGTAFFGWETAPVLLLLVVGIRFTECLADWILLRYKELTGPGRIGYFFSVPYTVGLGIYLASYTLKTAEFTGTTSWYTLADWMVVDPVIGLLLIAFFVFNLTRGFVGLVLPGRWYLWMHGRVGHDGTGLLARTAGIWLGMALVEGIVFYFWGQYPFLLAVFAGLRFSELFADWLYWGSSHQLTVPGQFVLLLLPPLQLFTGLYFTSVFLVIGG